MPNRKPMKYDEAVKLVDGAYLRGLIECLTMRGFRVCDNKEKAEVKATAKRFAEVLKSKGLTSRQAVLTHFEEAWLQALSKDHDEDFESVAKRKADELIKEQPDIVEAALTVCHHEEIEATKTGSTRCERK